MYTHTHTHVHAYVCDLRRYVYGHICFIGKWAIVKSLYLADSAQLEQGKELILPQYLHKKKVKAVATRETLRSEIFYTIT